MVRAASGLDGTLSSSSVTLASGASTTVTLTVTAPANITDSLPDNRTITATSGTNSAIYAKVAVNSYSGNPPPTQGQTIQNTIPAASQNIVVNSRTQVVHFSATVIDSTTNQPVTGTGKGVVIFYVGGNAVGTARTGDSSGVFAYDWTPGYNWTLTGQQAVQAFYSGLNTGNSSSSLLQSTAVTGVTLNLKPLATATVTPTTANYDGTAKAISVLLSPSGVSNQITYVDANNHSVATPTAAGVYTATIVITDSSYDSQPTTTGTLTISPAALTVTAANASRFVGAANPTFTGTMTGAVSGDGITVTYASSAGVNSPPGSYNIVPTLADPNTKLGNYTVTIQNGTLTITKATSSLSLGTSPANPSYGQPLTITATITPSSATGTVTFPRWQHFLGNC